MSVTGDAPFDLAVQVIRVLDRFEIEYALGGSMASSIFGEPRATADIDLAVRLSLDRASDLFDDLQADFYILRGSALDAIAAFSSFNLVATDSPLKIDIFVMGTGLLDRNQIDRRVLVRLPGEDLGIWVTSPEDQILRKISWRRRASLGSPITWKPRSTQPDTWWFAGTQARRR